LKQTYKIPAVRLRYKISTVKPTCKALIMTVTICSERYCCLEGRLLATCPNSDCQYVQQRSGGHSSALHEDR
jgi:hypothetical protein